jgi:hypothetical protein
MRIEHAQPKRTIGRRQDLLAKLVQHLDREGTDI